MTAAEAIAWLEAEASEAGRADLLRYGIPADHAFGVPMNRMLAWAKGRTKDHALAAALWADGRYEARTLAALVDDAGAVTAAQMDAWAEDFDNWAICDTVCFRLFDLAAPAWDRVAPWIADERLYVRRAGLALLWALALHDRSSPEECFASTLDAVAGVAGDARPHVAKAVTMVFRAVAHRNASLAEAVRATGARLAAGSDRTAAKAGRAAMAAAKQ